MTTTPESTTCYNHPDRETGLRCNRCDQYICASCAVLTPTGYRCKACIKEQKKVFDTAQPQDYLLSFIVAGFLAFLGGLLVRALSSLGFFLIYFTIGLAPAAGALIADVVRRVVKKRRSKPLFLTATIGVVAGGLLANLGVFIYLLLSRDFTALISILWPGVYIFLAASTAYMRLSGIQLNR